MVLFFFFSFFGIVKEGDPYDIFIPTWLVKPISYSVVVGRFEKREEKKEKRKNVDTETATHNQCVRHNDHPWIHR